MQPETLRDGGVINRMSTAVQGWDPHVKQMSRTSDVAFGTFFVALAVVTLAAAWEGTPIGAVLAALVMGLLGAEALVSAARGKASLLSRFGPLP